MARALAADARFLDAAERRKLARDRAGVDPDHPVFERLGDAPHPAQIAGVEVRREAELRVVGEADDVVLVLEAKDRRYGTEGLLARDQHRGIDAGDDGRLVEGAAERVPLAANHDLCALLLRVRDML